MLIRKTQICKILKYKKLQMEHSHVVKKSKQKLLDKVRSYISGVRITSDNKEKTNLGHKNLLDLVDWAVKIQEK